RAGALNFNGINNYVDLGPGASLGNFGNQITVAAWVNENFKSTNREEPVVSRWGNSPSYILYALDAVISGNQKNQFVFDVWVNGAGYAATFNTDTSNRGSWHYLVGTYNGSVVSVYLDGALKNTTAASGSIGVSADNTVLGNYGGPYLTANATAFNGSIDEVRIYNRSLSAAEINQLYLSNLKKINSTSWEFDTNQTNLTDGAYTYAGYATDTQGYTDTTGLRSVTLAYNPVVSTYGGSTTNFTAVPDMTNVTNLTLEQVGKGKIQFPSSHSVNAAGQDYDSNIVMGNGFISVNSTGLDSSFNSTATLSMNLTGVYSGSSAPAIYYYEPFVSSLSSIVSNGAVCSAPRCTGV
ncbi:MAG TPA: LamG domain-containing protein, partial [Candidatus Micrarchaeota archaeon]|nr:LamG domain-containing protein [Candidatus Micrarchaeota archaeon]